MNTLEKTARAYGFLWAQDRYSRPAQRWHFNAMQEAIPEPIVRGRAGIDVGTGCGYDACIMARSNPSVRIIGIDISDGIYAAAKLASGLDNVSMIKSSVLNMPAADGVFDFAYSFGVLHHILCRGCHA